MTDIVERLRTEAQEICADTYPRWKNADETMDEAALEIESLRQRLHEVSLSWQESQAREAKLREALEESAYPMVCVVSRTTHRA